MNEHKNIVKGKDQKHFVYPGATKESACQCRRCGFNPWVRDDPLEEEIVTNFTFLPGESHELKNLAGYSLELQRVRHE